jgi:hypothetical protein
MSRFTLFSLLLVGIGLLLLGFQSLQSLMGTEYVWKEVTIAGLLKPEHLKWIDSISWAMIHNALHYLIYAPLYLVMLVSGGVLLLFSGVLGKVR